MIRKIYRQRVASKWEIIEKETVDEIIFRTTKTRNRLMLELMARGGMRIGEVLKLTRGDIQGQKLTLREPKSGKEFETVFIPRKVADKLREYANENCKNPDDKIFPISYEAARMTVSKAGKLVGIHLRPHDLRRHAATFASRSGVPLEIVNDGEVTALAGSMALEGVFKTIHVAGAIALAALLASAPAAAELGLELESVPEPSPLDTVLSNVMEALAEAR